MEEVKEVRYSKGLYNKIYSRSNLYLMCSTLFVLVVEFYTTLLRLKGLYEKSIFGYTSIKIMYILLILSVIVNLISLTFKRERAKNSSIFYNGSTLEYRYLTKGEDGVKRYKLYYVSKIVRAYIEGDMLVVIGDITLNIANVETTSPSRITMLRIPLYFPGLESIVEEIGNNSLAGEQVEYS